MQKCVCLSVMKWFGCLPQVTKTIKTQFYLFRFFLYFLMVFSVVFYSFRIESRATSNLLRSTSGSPSGNWSVLFPKNSRNRDVLYNICISTGCFMFTKNCLVSINKIKDNIQYAMIKLYFASVVKQKQF